MFLFFAASLAYYARTNARSWQLMQLSVCTNDATRRRSWPHPCGLFRLATNVSSGPSGLPREWTDDPERAKKNEKEMV